MRKTTLQQAIGQLGKRTAKHTQQVNHQALQSSIPTPNLHGAFLRIPSRRAYWSMTSVNESGNVYDEGGQGRTLTNNSSTAFGLDKVVSYAIGDGSADYLSRTDEAGFDITGAFTLLGYAYSDDTPAGNESIAGKWNTTLNQRAYLVRLTSTPAYQGTVSSDGTSGGVVTVTSTVTYTAATPFFYALVYTPSTSLILYINSGGVLVATSNTTSIPASVFNSSASFALMANGAGSELLDGRVYDTALSASALSESFLQWLFASTKGAYGL